MKSHFISSHWLWYQMEILTFATPRADNPAKGSAHTSPQHFDVYTMKVL